MSNLPCKDCITLAVCKQRVIVFQNSAYLSKLYSRCPILLNYLKERMRKNHADFNVYNHCSAVDFFFRLVI